MALVRSDLVSSSREHLATAGETYWQHMRFAGAVASLSVAAGMACLVHALVPGVCRNTASRTIGLVCRIMADRASVGEAAVEAAEAVAFALLFGMSSAAIILLWTLGAPALVALPLGIMAAAMPVVMLITNPDLEPEAEAGGVQGTARASARPSSRASIEAVTEPAT